MVLDFEIGPSFLVEDRLICVISERLLINAGKENIFFGVLISPIYVVIIEHDLRYAFSLLTGERVDLEDLFLRIPSLKEKLLLT